MQNFCLRLATKDDCKLLFDWRNDIDARENSFNKEIIPWQEHIAWFEKVLKDKNVCIYILMQNNNAIGQVRFTKENSDTESEKYVLSYSIDKGYRGCGFGKAVLQLAENEIAKNKQNVKLEAFVIKHNIASQVIFKRLGYSESEQENCYVYTKIARVYKDLDYLKMLYGGGVLFLTNNKNALSLFQWIEKRETVTLYSGRVNTAMLQNIQPKIIVSYNYRYIIKKDVIDFMKGNIINLHISYLPWNRGSSPNIWSFIENTPTGTSIHKIDSGLDTGDLIYQKQIDFDEETETLQTSYDKLNAEIVELLKINWQNIIEENYRTYKPTENGSYHKSKDLENFLQGNKIDYNMKIKDFRELYGTREK